MGAFRDRRWSPGESFKALALSVGLIFLIFFGTGIPRELYKLSKANVGNVDIMRAFDWLFHRRYRCRHPFIYTLPHTLLLPCY